MKLTNWTKVQCFGSRFRVVSGEVFDPLPNRPKYKLKLNVTATILFQDWDQFVQQIIGNRSFKLHCSRCAIAEAQSSAARRLSPVSWLRRSTCRNEIGTAASRQAGGGASNSSESSNIYRIFSLFLSLFFFPAIAAVSRFHPPVFFPAVPPLPPNPLR